MKRLYLAFSIHRTNVSIGARRDGVRHPSIQGHKAQTAQFTAAFPPSAPTAGFRDPPPQCERCSAHRARTVCSLTSSGTRDYTRDYVEHSLARTDQALRVTIPRTIIRETIPTCDVPLAPTPIRMMVKELAKMRPAQETITGPATSRLPSDQISYRPLSGHSCRLPDRLSEPELLCTHGSRERVK